MQSSVQMMDYNEIEGKWQDAWEKAGIFSPDPGEKEAFMVTAAFPYANAPQHIGHLRTFGTADVVARYKRMRGYNVLYPMAFHATGTPILAFAKRIKNKDGELVKELQTFHVPDHEIEKMTDPLYIANYFIKEIREGMKLAGYSIDWRRSFVSIEPLFSKFVEWQFGILSKKGMLTKGRHPVGWCPNENNAVGMHDTKHDVEPEISSETIIRFKLEDEDSYLLCTTYRPETLPGVTNIFVNGEAVYSLCRIEGMSGSCYVAKSSLKALSYQFNIEELKEIKGSDLLSKMCINPYTEKSVPVFPGYFVDPEIGTGCVMSVPAHAPFDYIAIEKLKSQGYDIKGVQPVSVLEVKRDKHGSDAEDGVVPALRYLRAVNADVNATNELVKEATKAQYKDEFRYGIMTAGRLNELAVGDARELVRKELIEKGEASEIFVLTNEDAVYCRCGFRVVVKVVDNQWFINYGDKEWKKAAKEAFAGIRVLPGKSRNAFESAIDWIDLRAVVRAQGLGTKFPLEQDKIIESLSDSTIYMSFYTIYHLIAKLKPANLIPEFFDYVYLGKGNVDEVARASGIDYETIKKARESFTYWYKNTSRHSGPDLIFNHLTMYIFNHAAIFDKEFWPKQIVVNGMVLNEGEKMSKSLGNIIPLADGIRQYGADPMRFVEIGGADLFSDSEFNERAVNGVRERFELLNEYCSELPSMEAGELKGIDYWLYSRMNKKIKEATAAMENVELRLASTHMLYNTILELRRYKQRGGMNGMVLREYLSNVILLLQPMAPHVSEELWHALGNASFSSTEKWPSVDEDMINEKAEIGEDLIDSTISDITQVIELMQKKTGSKAKEVGIIIASQWKRDIMNSLSVKKDIKQAIDMAMANHKALQYDSAAKYAQALMKKVNELRVVSFTEEEEFKALSEAAEYISSVIGMAVKVEKEEESRSSRAARAHPMKPSIEAS